MNEEKPLNKKISELLSSLKEEVDFNALEKEELSLEDRLFLSILLNSKDKVDYLLKKGADPNGTNKKGTSILELALAFKREDIAHLLLKHGAMLRGKPKPKSKL